LKKMIALGSVGSSTAQVGTGLDMELTVDHQRKNVRVAVTKLPFLRSTPQTGLTPGWRRASQPGSRSTATPGGWRRWPPSGRRHHRGHHHPLLLRGARPGRLAPTKALTVDSPEFLAAVAGTAVHRCEGGTVHLLNNAVEFFPAFFRRSVPPARRSRFVYIWSRPGERPGERGPHRACGGRVQVRCSSTAWVPCTRRARRSTR